MSPTCPLCPSDRAKFVMQREMGIVLLRCVKNGPAYCTLPKGHLGECAACYRVRAYGSDCFGRKIPDIPDEILRQYSTLSCCM